MYLIRDLFEKQKHALELELVAGERGLARAMEFPEVQRPGLALSGYLVSHPFKRLMVFGKVEILYLRELDPLTRIKRLRGMLSPHTPGLIIARGYRPPRELVELCNKEGIALFCSTMNTMNLVSKLILLLGEEFSPIITCHGTLVEAFGVGIMIQGDSSVGKSEAALGLIERGHRLVSDDVVRVRVREGLYLEGSGPELTRHLIEIRGIGIINVAHLYGAVCVREAKSVDIVVKLEEWDDTHYYDRVGLDEKYTEMLGVQVPYHILPVKPGRDLVLLLETIALNHRLKEMGYHSAQEFNQKLLGAITRRSQIKGGAVWNQGQELNSLLK